MHSNSSLSLNRRLQNPLFESWKLGSDFVRSRSCLQLQGQVYQGASDAVDFLHTKAAVLRNHLIESQGRLFVATNNDDQSVVINEVNLDPAGGAQLLPIAGETVCCCCTLLLQLQLLLAITHLALVLPCTKTSRCSTKSHG
jgi:hypothetical protein